MLNVAPLVVVATAVAELTEVVVATVKPVRGATVAAVVVFGAPKARPVLGAIADAVVVAVEVAAGVPSPNENPPVAGAVVVTAVVALVVAEPNAGAAAAAVLGAVSENPGKRHKLRTDFR